MYWYVCNTLAMTHHWIIYTFSFICCNAHYELYQIGPGYMCSYLFKATTILVCCWLTHWGRVTHICVSKLTSICSDNGLSPGRRQAMTWTNDGILLIGPLATNFSDILSKIHTFSFTKMHLKTSSVKWRLFGLGLNELSLVYPDTLRLFDE